MKNLIRNNQKAIAMFLVLWLSLAVVSAITMLADTGLRTTPVVSIRHEQVGECEYSGNEIHRMVISAMARDGFSFFGMVMSYDNTTVLPVDSETFEDITPPSNTYVITGTNAPFSLLIDYGFDTAPASWVVREERTGFSFDAFVVGPGVTPDTLSDVFAFYYRIISTNTESDEDEDFIIQDAFRVEDGLCEDSMIGNNAQSSFIRPGVKIMSGSNIYVWGPNRADRTHILIDDENIIIVYDEPDDDLESEGELLMPQSAYVQLERTTYAADTVPDITVTLNLAGGALQAHENHTFTGQPGFVVSALPTPTRAGYIFGGWLFSGAVFTAPFVAHNAMTLYASWTAAPPPNLTVNLNLVGGALPHNTPHTFTGQPGFTIHILPVPTRYGYTFTGWMTNNAFVAAPLAIHHNMTLYAVWAPMVVATPSPSPTPTATPAPNTHTVIFSPGPYGSFPAGETGIRIINHGAQIATAAAPTPTRAGHVFAGWRHNDAAVAFPLTINSELTLTAAWTATATATPAPTQAPSTGGGGGGTGASVNPQTSPLRVSFMIFGAVMLTGLAALGLVSISKKHVAQVSQYDKALARHNREKRITDMIDN
ncbi:MAG: InlB B-repeat-containing protein [Defluviitaleaceae bacterium]|nr:InlB B-repeat-containing protein [Defluviitaleaceae bacterium]